MTNSGEVEMLERLARAVDFRDDDTGVHTKRVGIASARLAEIMGLESAAVDMIRLAAPLHDIGMVGIPDAVMLKPGPLTPEERKVMERHTIVGSDILKDGRSDLVRLCQRIARSHHERWDGSGYPDALVGEDIPPEARIVHVADFLDALTHDRPYRTAWTPRMALDTIVETSGSNFDPAVVEALMKIHRESGIASLVS
ncbi:MAG TPA: HD domain-containing phosphohydrolase [Gemmatimonadaceae bacterium]|nr:HD domain-containing phosphohydrolase [Gemmatimonadaceae bacterium]